ncbi:hypothetical protein GCM10011418_32680 [Sphingobacterium alkalisoli]|nr:hypothetical protein GCM10011418_32680 [Sphingobacterium alkalisoli]
MRNDNDLVISWTVNYLDGSSAFNLNQNIDILVKNIDNSFENYLYNGQELKFRFNNGEIAPLEMCNGTFYSVVEFQSGQKYYSEVFKIDSNVNLSELIKIEWAGDCKIAAISYINNYKNLLFADSAIERSTPGIIEEGEEIEGRFIPSFVKYTNRYRISLIAPDWLIESLTMIGLHPNVLVTTNNGLYVSQMENVKVENLEWLNPPCYARLDLTFEQDEESLYTTCCG